MFFSFTCECEYSDRILIQNCSAYLSDGVGRTEKKWCNLKIETQSWQTHQADDNAICFGGVAVVMMVGVGAALLYFSSGNLTLAPSIRI
jgi:hypothetical protein